MTPTPIANDDLDLVRQPPAEAPVAGRRDRSMTIANRSRIRSMNTVPNVRLSDTGLLIFSRYAR